MLRVGDSATLVPAICDLGPCAENGKEMTGRRYLAGLYSFPVYIVCDSAHPGAEYPAETVCYVTLSRYGCMLRVGNSATLVTVYSDIPDGCVLFGPGNARFFIFSDSLLAISHAMYLVSNKVALSQAKITVFLHISYNYLS